MHRPRPGERAEIRRSLRSRLPSHALGHRAQHERAHEHGKQPAHQQHRDLTPLASAANPIRRTPSGEPRIAISAASVYLRRLPARQPPERRPPSRSHAPRSPSHGRDLARERASRRACNTPHPAVTKTAETAKVCALHRARPQPCAPDPRNAPPRCRGRSQFGRAFKGRRATHLHARDAGPLDSERYQRADPAGKTGRC